LKKSVKKTQKTIQLHHFEKKHDGGRYIVIGYKGRMNLELGFFSLKMNLHELMKFDEFRTWLFIAARKMYEPPVHHVTCYNYITVKLFTHCRVDQDARET
jgi:hypothetical protein